MNQEMRCPHGKLQNQRCYDCQQTPSAPFNTGAPVSSYAWNHPTPQPPPPESEWRTCPQCHRENLVGTWKKRGGKCPNCDDLWNREHEAAPSQEAGGTEQQDKRCHEIGCPAIGCHLYHGCMSVAFTEGMNYAAHENQALREQLQRYRSMGIVELAVEYQSVRDYIEHWEERTLRAELKVDVQEKEIAALKEEREAIKASLGIDYSDDLGEEGNGYEVPAEPGPQYFETLPKAVHFVVKLNNQADDELMALRSRIAELEGKK